MGLIGRLSYPGRIRNLVLQNVSVKIVAGLYCEGENFIGGLVGRNDGGMITGCTISGSVGGGTMINGIYAGGLVGYNTYGMIASCFSESIVAVVGEQNSGGLVGKNEGGMIVSCYATGAIGDHIESYVENGGLCGVNDEGTILSCFASGSVYAEFGSGGGLCGSNTGMIDNCFATGTVIGEYGPIGGLCGTNSSTIANSFTSGIVNSVWGIVGGLCGRNGGAISRCYSAGILTAGVDSENVGGLCGINSGTIETSFWDIETSGQTTSSGGTGLPTSRMKLYSTYTSAGWDMSSVWMICQGIDYPHLRWEGYECPRITDYSGGSGTAEDPFKIGTVQDLQAVGTVPWDWEKHFMLIADLECQGMTLSPLGSGEIPFSGDFNGNGHRIVNITQPLFDRVDPSGRIHHLSIQATLSNETTAGLVRTNFGSLTNCSIETEVFPFLSFETFGGLVIWNYGTLENCSVSGQMGSGKTAGGLVAWNYGWLENCTTYSITADCYGFDDGEDALDDVLGGLVGHNQGEMKHCSIYNMGLANPDGIIGGLVGQNDGTLYHCSFMGVMVSAFGNPPYSFNGNMGGLVGQNDGTLYHCSSTGDIDLYGWMETIGGLVGQNNHILDKCSFEGIIYGDGEGGGLVGFNNGFISQCRVDGRVVFRGKGGGLAAHNWGLIRDSYARGYIGWEGAFGGIAGVNEGRVINCFAAGHIGDPCDGPGGGLIGERGTECHIEEICESCGGEDICCEWRPVCESVGEEIASFSDLCFWHNCDPDGTGPNTEVMQKRATFTAAGWDFLGESINGTADIWRMCINGVDYPRLSWEFSYDGDLNCPDGVGMDDLVYLVQRWLAKTVATVGSADANEDGIVNLNDLSILSSNWMRQ